MGLALQFDEQMAQQAEAAASQGEKLCYVGLVDLAAKTCRVALEVPVSPLWQCTHSLCADRLLTSKFPTTPPRRTFCMQAYPREHAFAQLSGSDNIVSFTSERYHAQPMFVRGPGAGAEVTAAGVFSDLILLARSLGARC